MQSDIPPLPISCLTDNNTRLRRNSNNLKTRINPAQDSIRSDLAQTTNRTNLPTCRKQLHPLIAGPSPYKTSARYNPPDTAKSSKSASKTSVISQRVCSAKMLRIKQLQNQLADAHFHLNELSNENKLLKAIQKRQDAALRRYEGSNAELPRIINTHHEDLRVLQTKHKKLRSQYKEKCDQLKERENELHSLQVQNKKLLQLSKDRHLGEREKLQTQVFDLNHRVNQQDETIQTLKRKLALETKYLKHQLHVELVKQKDLQRTLQDTQEKLKKSEQLNKQRAKQYYEASNLAYFNRERAATSSQSLTNLNETRSDNVSRGVVSFRRRTIQAATGQSLPALNRPTSMMTRSQSQENPPSQSRTGREMPSPIVDETHLSYEQIKNFSLPKPQNSPALHRASFSTSRGSVRDSPIQESDEGESAREGRKTRELAKSLAKEFLRQSDEDGAKDERRESLEKAESSSVDLTSRSRLLHARLVSSATEGLRPARPIVSSRSRSLTKENMDNIMEYETETKYDRDSVITVISRDALRAADPDVDNAASNSDLESEIELPVEFQADEDENAIRKSDIDTDETELAVRADAASSRHSGLFMNVPAADFPKKDGDDDEDDVKSEFKSINGLTLVPRQSAGADDAEKSFSKNPWGDSGRRYAATSLSQEAKPGSVLDPLLSSGRDDDRVDATADCRAATGKSSSDSSQDFEETIELPESNVKRYGSNDASDYANGDKRFVSRTSELAERGRTGGENSKSFDKAKLLAAIKAIDDNENIEFVDQKSRRNSASNRLQITENLYRGIPTHSRRKSDIMKELFSDAKVDNNKK